MRAPVMSDWRFVFECYQDWPLSSKGPVTEQRAVDMTRRWMFRDDEVCRVEPGVGIITYRQSFFVAKVDELVVHPDHRGKGHARAIWRALRDELVSGGVVVAEFDAIPGPVALKVMDGTFEKVSEGIGERTGLPIITGRVTADMEI